MALANSPIMSAVGRLHNIGVSSNTKTPAPKPAPRTTSSVPKVPPDTMKKVAATKAQKPIPRELRELPRRIRFNLDGTSSCGKTRRPHQRRTQPKKRYRRIHECRECDERISK